ncbi:MAG: hypothetical protein GTN62_02845 [Gemmatimonadales bacterium]|nr:hypothetical protein [Gemmatimonadales bacterium]NIN10240.1 hypothetical protein [Gemmatimonadales bacterium]NIN49037.1 hypothetical protein [Gemmatimonadales bacterium]NIP06501.1 hypothetical protein [Gemmatimonadales bacterium]NIQ98844.1 hypothetical protein [Gemmatimonadales bacterium]
MRFTVMAAALLFAACSGGGGGNTPADTLTQRQRDSAIGASDLPGAGGVRKALEVSDTAAARRARLDSLQRRNP